MAKRDGQPLPGAVVTVERESAAPGPAPPVRAIMDQVNLAFAPDVLVIPVHSTIQFPNSDAVGHQVYSFSSARQFQLPLYRGKPYPPVQFDQPGVVTLGCNIHDNMIGYVYVTDAPHFGTTNAAGQWHSRDLNAGEYTVEIWTPRASARESALKKSIVLPQSAGPSIEFKFENTLAPAPAALREQRLRDY